MSSRLSCSMSEVRPTEVEADRLVAPAARLMAGSLQAQGEKTERKAPRRFQSLLGVALPSKVAARHVQRRDPDERARAVLAARRLPRSRPVLPGGVSMRGADSREGKTGD